MTRDEALRLGAERLAAAGIEQPRREARWLLAHALGVSQEALLADPAASVDARGYVALLARRAAREPLAFITGVREFWSLPLAVSSATLIPRADSETLIEAAAAHFPVPDQVSRVLDLGTGSGNLLLAALTEFPGAFGVGIDRTPAATALAARNAASLGLSGRAAFIVGDWTASLATRFDLVLSNPPYVETSAIAKLMPEVARHEPALALDGGPDGLDAYRRIIPELDRLLTPRGAAIIEVGATQAGSVASLAWASGLASRTASDLAGLPRALVLCKARS